MPNKSLAEELFNASMISFPEIYIFMDYGGKRQLRKLKIEGTQANLDKTYLLKDYQSIEMALNAMNLDYSHARDKKHDLPEKGPFRDDATLENILREITTPRNDQEETDAKKQVYVISLENEPLNDKKTFYSFLRGLASALGISTKNRPLDDQDKLYRFMVNKERLSLPLGKGIRITAYNRTNQIEATMPGSCAVMSNLNAYMER